MIHIFDTEIAKRYGVNAAVLLQNLGFWIKQNEANETNFYNGNYWTYNSRRAFKELFPYMSERQIYTALQKLIDDGLLVTGNFNKLAYDRTLWYALTQKGKSILHFDTMEDSKMSNGSTQNVKPIPDVNTNINSDVNTNKSDTVLQNNTAKKKTPKSTIFEDYAKDNSKLLEALQNFEKDRKERKQPMTDRAKQLFVNKLESLSSNPDEQIKIIEQSIENGWKSIYPLKGNQQKQQHNYNYSYGQEGVDYL